MWVYWLEEEFKNGVTLFDLACIIYRFKGSKYDWWYELYEYTIFIRDEQTLYLNTIFSYGS